MTPTVMVIDDSLTVRMDLAEAFRDSGFAVILCETAADARRELDRQQPDVIVLDVVLPDADGVTLLEELRRRPAVATTPVILLSSEAEVKDRIRGLSGGADAYVGKPYDSGYVIARASQLLRRQDTSAGDTLSILLIGDVEPYRQVLEEKLRAAGYRVVGTSSARDGLRRAADLRPAAVVVDGGTPDMDGTTVIRRIRLDPGLNATPCLLLDASEGPQREILALDAGADAYVRKNEGIDVILARLSAIVRAAEDSRDQASTASMMGPKRVLAVDDSLTFLEEVAAQLRGDGYDVIRATSGEEALELLAVEQVDGILLDILMPGLSGVETCRRIKNSPALRHIPLILLTSLDEPDAVVEGMNAGADDYVIKSVDYDVVGARLRAQLRRKQFEDENRRMREKVLRKEAEAHAAREKAETRAALLAQLEVKNRDLERLNHELQTFAYSVSHDLRQPLRSMDGFSQVLLEEYGAQLDARGRHYLERVRAGAQRMGELIDGLLMLSRVTRKALTRSVLQIDVLARGVVERLQEADREREVEITIAEPMEAVGDPQLIESILENLLGNAWKFSAGQQPARIEVGLLHDEDVPIYFVRDNGAGFKMDYADKLFVPFQRLHSEREFSGTGIGLATTQRIVHRHGGKIWAESRPGQGATFFFTLSSNVEGSA